VGKRLKEKKKQEGRGGASDGGRDGGDMWEEKESERHGARERE